MGEERWGGVVVGQAQLLRSEQSYRLRVVVAERATGAGLRCVERRQPQLARELSETASLTFPSPC